MWNYLLTTGICYILASILLWYGGERWESHRDKAPYNKKDGEYWDLAIFFSWATATCLYILGFGCFVNFIVLINTGHPIE